MKQDEKGPFWRVRWYCADGVSLPPKAGACVPHGGGIQHGEWSERTRQIRAAGFTIANVLAELDVADFQLPARGPDKLKQILLEQYLIQIDDGWIFRRARFYRGALQMEDESAAARNILTELLTDPSWHRDRFALVREAVRLLPHQQETATVARMRDLATRIAEQDAAFEQIRNKIHIQPEAGDAETVRRFAEDREPAKQLEDLERLARTIEKVYQTDIAESILQLARKVSDTDLAANLRRTAKVLQTSAQPAARLAASGDALKTIRQRFSNIARATTRLQAMDAGLLLEQAAFVSASTLQSELERATRHDRVTWLASAVDALYGIGFLSARQQVALSQALASLHDGSVPLAAYREQTSYLARASRWADQTLKFHFGATVDHLAKLEPLVSGYLQDRLRGSPLLFYAAVTESLVRDANGLLGVSHRLFSEPIHAGLHALNPGLARGVLRSGREPISDPKGIYLLSETRANLPPVAGILTQGAGNTLSHVQLLARNLSIPNAVVDTRWRADIERHMNQAVVLAVSPGGIVQLAADGPEWDQVFGTVRPTPGLNLEPDLKRLDTSRVTPLSLDELRAENSGQWVGPKAANLGELKHHFPDAVSDGIVIPFGVFHALLERPFEPGGPRMFDWIRSEYEWIDELADIPAQQEQRVDRFLRRLRQWILTAEPSAEFRAHLRRALERVLGPDRSYGVFVRSDTNVEDLPNFTGAGLNLTVPHVVGFENVLRAISSVWASPFTKRAYAWRQARMAQPDYVYPYVLLMRSVAVEKSGVLVTVDVDTGGDQWLSIAVNEGIGGAVTGQSAEELRIHRTNGQVVLLAQATSPEKRGLHSEGGIRRTAASGRDYVLSADEIDVLRRLAVDIDQRLEMARDGDGNPVPLDIEFGFQDGKLALFQVRPFVQAKHARRTRYLMQMDAARERAGEREVDMTEPATTS